MSDAPIDLQAVRLRAERAHGWCVSHPDPPHLPLEYVPLSTREHFEHDVPAMLAELEALRARVVELERECDFGAGHGYRVAEMEVKLAAAVRKG